MGKTDEVIGGRSICNYFSKPEGKLVPVHAINAYEGVEIILHSFLNINLKGRK
jgi:hypothetical protein